MTPTDFASKIEHTLLKAEATPAMIDQLCDEAIRYGFAAVCVNPTYVAHCEERIGGSHSVIATVVGFPLGATRTDVKVKETLRAIDDGALEIDMVIRLGDLIAGNTVAVCDDIAAIADAVHTASSRHELKVILETAALTEEQIRRGCQCAAEARADFVKTSTGFHPAGGATVQAVRLMRQCSRLKIKAAGGIRDLAAAQALLDAGAVRLGCSASVNIMQQLEQALAQPV